MVDRALRDNQAQQERYGADFLVLVSKASEANGPYQPKASLSVPAILSAQPHPRVKELLAQPVGEQQQQNMSEGEHVLGVAPLIQQQQFFEQHNIARNRLNQEQRIGHRPGPQESNPIPLLVGWFQPHRQIQCDFAVSDSEIR